MTDDTRRPFSRRELLKTATGAAAALSLARAGAAQSPAPAPPGPPGGTMIGVAFERRDKVRLGLVGCGGRGTSLLHDLLGIDGVEVKAVCDIVPEKVAKAQAAVVKAGQKQPEGYAKGDHDFENLCRRGDLDLVYVATPWNWHVPMAVAAMENGVHAGVEVPSAVTLEECWRLVDVSERTRRHCMILENCCYGWSELLVLNLVRAGMLGELTHAECAYIHDLRSLLFENRGRGALAAVRAPQAERQPVPDPRPRAGGAVPGHPPRRPLRPPRLDELALARAAGVPRPRAAAGRPAAAGDLRLRGREHEPPPDREGPHGPAAARRGLAAAVQPHQHGLGHARHLRRLPAADLLRRGEPARAAAEEGRGRGLAARSSRTRRSGRRAGSRTATRTRCGRSSRRSPGRAGTAGWTT